MLLLLVAKVGEDTFLRLWKKLATTGLSLSKSPKGWKQAGCRRRNAFLTVVICLNTTDEVKMVADFPDNPYILITDRKFLTFKEVCHCWKAYLENQPSLLIIADDVDGEALPTLCS